MSNTGNRFARASHESPHSLPVASGRPRPVARRVCSRCDAGTVPGRGSDHRSELCQESFHLARQQDPDAILLINEFGFEQGSDAVGRRASILKAIDHLKARNVPVQALGIQAHLHANGFARQFDMAAYRTFLANVAARGLQIWITEMDVQDDGLKLPLANWDAGVADVYSRYLSVALAEPAVKVVLNFGLSDRYTWLQEDFPRRDGLPRRPLPFDENLQPKPAYDAILRAFQNAPARTPI